MCTVGWLNLFRGVVVRHLANVTSDHYPLLLKTKGGDFGGPKPFKFEHMWAYVPPIFEVV